MRSISKSVPGAAHSYDLTLNVATTLVACATAVAISFVAGTCLNSRGGGQLRPSCFSFDARPSPHPPSSLPPVPRQSGRKGRLWNASRRPRATEAELRRRHAEPLVHPAMMTWTTDSTKIAVAAWDGEVDGAAAATVREILRYKDVKRVDVVTGYGGNGDAVPSLSSRHWGDDERIELLSDFNGDDEDGKLQSNKYAVIFLTNDAGLHSPQRRSFFDAVSKASPIDGSIVVGLGDPHTQGFWGRYDDVVQFVGEYSFYAVHVYEEDDCGTMTRCAFLIMSRSPTFGSSWFAHLLFFDFGVHNNLLERGPNDRFDGTAMERYRTTHRAYQNRFCGGHRDAPLSQMCGALTGIDPRLRDFPPEAFEVRQSTLGEGAGRGLFARVDIPAGSLIMEREAVNSVHFPESTLDVIDKTMWELLSDIPEVEEIVDMLFSYYEGYGYSGSILAGKEIFVDSGILTFANHGCRGTNNLGSIFDKSITTPEECANLTEEAKKRPWALAGLSKLEGIWKGYNPILNRHNYLISGGLNCAHSDITAGEELFGNYVLYQGSVSVIGEEKMNNLLSMIDSECRGESIGIVKKFDSNVFDY